MLKVFYKDKPDIDPYKMAYGLMPSQAVSCLDAKQMYINGHFCYADKFAILTIIYQLPINYFDSSTSSTLDFINFLCIFFPFNIL